MRPDPVPRDFRPHQHHALAGTGLLPLRRLFGPRRDRRAARRVPPDSRSARPSKEQVMGAIQSSQVNQTCTLHRQKRPRPRPRQRDHPQDAARTKALAQYTVMAYIVATGKWIPWNSVTATDGSAYPAGILMTDGGFTAAQLAAADVTGAAILVGGPAVLVDSSQLVFDTGVGGTNAALALTTAIASGTRSAPVRRRATLVTGAAATAPARRLFPDHDPRRPRRELEPGAGEIRP